MSNNPLLPLTYHDLVCVDDLDLLGRETQSDLETLEQDVYHILQENLGSNIDDPSRGAGLPGLLSGTEPQLQSVASRLGSQLSEDPRIDAATVTLTNTDIGAYTLLCVVSVNGAVIGLTYGYVAAGGLLTFLGSNF